ncbi:hypothetical protein DKX38_002260 [Salix brachista]|uniref:Protein kinase domain-containing protein n=1 Tax=Salix brachista TaxID=2182728 RepID=A0A5N5NN54_9ROSI|nr:hypothetical protein DKX38_002260 [Salix brachista]
MAPFLQAVLAAAATFFLITLIFAFIALVCKSTKNQDYQRRQRRHHQTRTVPNPEHSSITNDESATFDPSMNRISMEELKMSTKNFSTDLIIGDGSFGLVYKAKIFNGSTVAIKKLDPDAFQGFREFRAEMETLGKLRHQNIVKILGIEASQSHVSTQVAGTMGYMPPEYKEGAAATVRVDVYSFGILMFEVATAERPNLPKVMEGKEVWLIEWARKMLGQNRHMEMLDSNTPKEGLSEDEVKEYFRIASLCTEEFRGRPAMSEVVGLLKKLSS